MQQEFLEFRKNNIAEAGMDKKLISESVKWCENSN